MSNSTVDQSSFKVVCNSSARTIDHAGNEISTTKYSAISFFPKALFEQYRRIANFYFTAAAVLSFTIYSPLEWWTMVPPLVFVLSVSIAKEFFEDFNRARSDDKVNQTSTQIWENYSWVTKTWRECKCGDIVLISRDEFFPADLLLINSSLSEGACYVDTVNLDGETNLKGRNSLPKTLRFNRENIDLFEGVIEAEMPNNSLYTFSGNLKLDDGEVIPIGPENILLRDSSLRNTEWIIGAVVYCGFESKVMMNASEAPSKRSRLEIALDYIVASMFILLLMLSISGAAILSVWTQSAHEGQWYLCLIDSPGQFDPNEPGLIFLFSFVSGFILYGYLIPISMYVQVEIVKVVQSMIYINYDLKMMDLITFQHAEARTSNLNEELGQIQNILSDKTGTLTQNLMEFFKCSIAGVEYGHGFTEIEISVAEQVGKPIVPSSSNDLSIAMGYKESFFNFYDKRLLPPGTWITTSEDCVIAELYFSVLAVCNTVIPEGPLESPYEINYKAESPDESALVVAARAFGFILLERSLNGVVVKHVHENNRNVTYEVIEVIEFNSTRKRMSVVVRREDSKLLLLTKGADSVICDRLDHLNSDNARILEKSLDHLDKFANAGLRTLALAYRYLEEESFLKWKASYFQAKTSLFKRAEKMMEVAEDIEQNLILLGCTAIEDKLQSGVPRSIASLHRGGLGIWVLTGDKVGTAINIGYACRLLDKSMVLHEIKNSSSEISANVENFGEFMRSDSDVSSSEHIIRDQLVTLKQSIPQDQLSGSDQHALVIDGKALSVALSTSDLAELFLNVTTRCKAVICCRVSPKQKGDVTRLVKHSGKMTLGIGDGANDVGMIQAANIGVGISGQEGQQAVMASDFSITQFSFLERLLLLHGRNSYKRNARMVNFFFYKNLLFGMTLFLFNISAFSSGQLLYDDLATSFYNLFFTSLHVFAIGWADMDVNPTAMREYPELYLQGMKNENFTARTIISWAATGIYQSIFLYFVCLTCYESTSSDQAGKVMGMWSVGLTMFTCCIFTVTIQIASITEFWTSLHHIFYWGSLLLWYIYLVIYGFLDQDTSRSYFRLFWDVNASASLYWITCLFTSFAIVLPDFCCRALWRYYFPSDHHIIQEISSLSSSLDV